MGCQSLQSLLSASVAQLVLLLFLLFHSSSSSSSPLTLISTLSPISNSRFQYLYYTHLLLHTSAILSSLSPSRKRRRTESSSSSSTTNGDDDIHLHTTCKPTTPLLSNPDSFKIHFRMTSSTFEWLAGLLEPLLDCRDPINSPLNLPPEIRLGLGLLRLSTGAGYPELSRRFMVSDWVSRFCFKQLCRVLCTNFRFWISFPSSEELQFVSTSFHSIAGIPNCCGAIRCVRFPISHCDFEEDDLSAQIVVDSTCRIQSIVAGYRGSFTEFRVLKSSNLYKDIERGVLLRGSPPLTANEVSVRPYLVGGEEYPLLPWLMVPYSDPPPGSPEESFNSAHQMMGASARRTALSLKSWGVLGAPMEEEVKMAIACIGACSILHNALLMRGDESGLWGAEGDDYSCMVREVGACNGTSVAGICAEAGDGATMRGALTKKAWEFSNIKQ